MSAGRSLPPRAPAVRMPVSLPLIGGGGVRPGVDLSDNARLRELLESERDAGLREQDGRGAETRQDQAGEP